MLDNPYDPHPVFAAYPADCRIRERPNLIKNLGHSGSLIWRVSSERGMLCLRRWPKEFSDCWRLRWIQGVLDGVYHAGFPYVPVPIRTNSGEVFVDYDNYLWQLEPWMAGEADVGAGPFRSTSLPRIQAALAALAQFHVAVKANRANCLSDGPAPGIIKRLSQFNTLETGRLNEFGATIISQRAIWPELAERGATFLVVFGQARPRTVELLRKVSMEKGPMWPCIRDIHRQHVLFTEDRVTGIVDFGAMQPDHPACDIARLLSSFAGDDTALWEIGLKAYQRVLPLNETDRELVRAYDQSGVLLSGINWLRWVFVEGRQFENRAGVLARFDEIFGRLVHLASRMFPKHGVIV